MSDQINSNENSAKSIWLDFLKERWGIYIVGVISVLLTNLMQVLSPKIIGWIIDFFADQSIPSFFIGADRKTTFLYLFIFLLFSRLLINIFRFGWRITLGRQTHYACSGLKKAVWNNVRYFSKHDLDYKFTKGILMNVQTSDANSARFIFGFTLVAITDVLFLGLFTFIAISLINFKMALMSFFVLLFVPIFIRKISSKEILQFKKIQEILSSFNDLASQSVSTIKMQRLTQTGSFWEKKLTSISNEHRIEKLVGINLSLFYVPIMGFASVVSYLILFILGIKNTMNGNLSVGDFISIQGLIFLLHDPLMSLGFIVSEWKKGFTALERLTEVFHNSQDSTLLFASNENVGETEDVLIVKNLSFSYPNENKPIIDSFNLEIKRSDRVGVIGEIGSGKSTLIRLLSGLERNYSFGEIYFNNNKFNFYSHQFLRGYIGYVPQKPFLFADTVRANVLVDLNLTDDEIWHFLDLAGLKDDVLNFPFQLDTQLGEWGINLSGGQKQRLTIARTLARKPQIIFFDDCLSAVDTVTEEKILNNLNFHLTNTTIIWVAHRKSTLKYCNKIINLSNETKR